MINPGTLKLAKFGLKTFSHSLYFTKNVSFDSAQINEASKKFQAWAQEVCKIFEIQLHVSGNPILKESGLLIGNHMSYLDIPVICSHDPINFVAKSEMMNWPIIGRVGHKIGTIFHDRKNPASKKSTAELIKNAIQFENKRVCVFPAGTTSLVGKAWKPGVFKLAHEIQCPVQFFSICYRPAQIVAYKSGSMLKHALQLNTQGPIDAFLHFSPVVKIHNPEADFKYWSNWNRTQIDSQLIKQTISF